MRQKLADAWDVSIDGINLRFFRCFFHLIWTVFFFSRQGSPGEAGRHTFQSKGCIWSFFFFLNKFRVSAVKNKWISLTAYSSFVLYSCYQ